MSARSRDQCALMCFETCVLSNIEVQSAVITLMLSSRLETAIEVPNHILEPGYLMLNIRNALRCE